MIFFLYVRVLILRFFLYADDAKLFSKVESIEDRSILQTCLNSLNDWCNEWSISMNVEKCMVLRINNRFDADFKYKIGDRELKNVSMAKDLGIVFECNLEFNVHMDDKIKMANKMLVIINKNFMHLDVEAFKCLYTSQVRTHLEYGVQVWAPWKLKDIERLEKVQKRATKMVLACKDMKYLERLKFLKLPTLRYRRTRGDMIMVFNILHFYMEDSCPKLIKKTESRTRGHEKSLVGDRFKKNQKKFGFRNRVVKVWNDLPAELVNCENVNIFKKKLDFHWADCEFVYDWREECG